MPLGQSSGQPPSLSREKITPPFLTSSMEFRHVISGLLSLASPDGMLSRLLLQRSPPSLLTIAACSGLRPAPDCRPRGANPHLLDSSTSPFFGDVFVTHRFCSTCWCREAGG